MRGADCQTEHQRGSALPPAIAACLPVLLLLGCAVAPAGVRDRDPGVSPRDAADRQLHGLLDTALNAPEPEATVALGEFVELWKSSGLGGRHRLDLRDPGGIDYAVRFAEPHLGCYSPDYFDELHAASTLDVRKIPHHTRDGVGAPLVALRENRHAERIERFYPPEAITRPITARATPGPPHDGTRPVTIELLCPLTFPEVETPDGPRPLAADFSAPWAALLARAGELNQSGWLDIVRGRALRDPQLYLMEPYHPEKEPLIMIHGLFSTPLAWAELSNDLWADDAIRSRYQIWHYHYNTSAPALYSARMLRDRLRALRPLLDPDGDDPAMRRTTVIAHSMGGLIAKALVVRPGDVFWKAAFTVPPEDLKLTPADRALLTEAFAWQPDPTIHRIIHIAVPHRGSDYADNPLGRIGRWITRPPDRFTAFYQRISADNPQAFTPAYRDLASGRLDSVGALSPRQPTIQILSRLPHGPGVRTHSIIGNRGADGPPGETSDGIVPYASSHLPEAESELILPADHGVFRHPGAVAEIKRILKLP